MTIVFSDTNTEREHDFSRYKEQWENSVLTENLKVLADIPDEDRRQLAKIWFIGAFNGSAAGLYANPEDGSLEWMQAGPTQFDLIYTGPMGIQCSLGRIYEQPNGTWAALVIAGAKDNQFEAMGAAEWAISRLSSFA